MEREAHFGAPGPEKLHRADRIVLRDAGQEKLHPNLVPGHCALKLRNLNSAVVHLLEKLLEGLIRELDRGRRHNVIVACRAVAAAWDSRAVQWFVARCGSTGRMDFGVMRQPEQDF